MHFKDRSNRDITLKESYNVIYAYCNNNGQEILIGQITFEVSTWEDYRHNEKQIAYVHTANIASEYQRQGIATKMIQYAKESFDEVLFAPDMGHSGNNDSIHYSSEGLAFKNSCERQGITRTIEL